LIARLGTRDQNICDGPRHDAFVNRISRPSDGPRERSSILLLNAGGERARTCKYAGKVKRFVYGAQVRVIAAGIFDLPNWMVATLTIWSSATLPQGCIADVAFGISGPSALAAILESVKFRST